MGDNDDRVIKVDQKFFKPCDRIQIQMVGRLIKEKDIRISEEGFCKKNFHFLSAVEIFHNSIVKVRFNSQTIKKNGRITFSFPSVQFGKFAFKLTGTHTILFCEIFFHIDRIFFLHNLIKAGITHDYCVQYLTVIIFIMVLFKNRETLALIHRDIAFARFQFSRKNF